MQTNPLKSFLLIGAGAAAVWMATNPKENATRIRNWSVGIKEKLLPTNVQHHDGFPVHQAANPDPYDVNNNEMVSEGSVYGVNYYNERLQ